jgi:hydrogenase maturation protein HypF
VDELDREASRGCQIYKVRNDRLTAAMQVRKQIEVSGVVQGVGFRPFVFRLAKTQQLTGTVRNTAAGVTIEVQGSPQAIEQFAGCLPVAAPALARISSIVARDVPARDETEFRILSSQDGRAHTLISPDIAVCPDCLRELFDPADRRYRYPFINCTNCGPRFTIVSGIPYDRANTSMAVFPMCAMCQAEYDDPLNRRFHAQPNACPNCGPHVEFCNKSGSNISDDDPIAKAVEVLRTGNIVAIKGVGGFHLAVDALNPDAVKLLRERKRRIEKPFAIMVPDVETAREYCEVSPVAQIALESAVRPIVLLPRNASCAMPGEVAPGNRELGIFLPYAPLHYLLLEQGRFNALVMTSGNLSEEPIAIDNQEALGRLGDLADFFLIHNRDILLRCDDSVVRSTNRRIRHLRRSRGFVPVPVFLKDEQPCILAVGGELKNTVCLAKGRHAFLSQHIGDLENLEGYRFFAEAINHLENVLEIEPETVAYDLHPDYFSSRWALQQERVRLVGVQHHHAHIASCMAENHLEGRVIGIALDGTGYGTDGKIWGGEVLLAGYDGFERRAHLEYVPLPGGAAAIREPWRMGVSYLAHHFGREFFEFPIPFVHHLNYRKTETLLRMTEQNINSPLSSSCGRLFDAVAALVGLRQQVNFEAQAAIELEMVIDPASAGSSYPIPFTAEGDTWVISTRDMFEALLHDLKNGAPIAEMSQRFHNGLVQVFAQISERIRDDTGLNRVCLSGGAFNNVYLCNGLESQLCSAGFEVFTQNEVPAGDGGLSLGQAMIAAHRTQSHVPLDMHVKCCALL